MADEFMLDLAAELHALEDALTVVLAGVPGQQDGRARLEERYLQVRRRLGDPPERDRVSRSEFAFLRMYERMFQ